MAGDGLGAQIPNEIFETVVAMLFDTVPKSVNTQGGKGATEFAGQALIIRKYSRST